MPRAVGHCGAFPPSAPSITGPQYDAPARAEDLTGLPPTFMDVGMLALFRDEDIAFAQRLMQAGVPTELHVNPGAYHAAEVFAPQSALSQRLWARRFEALRRGLA